MSVTKIPFSHRVYLFFDLQVVWYQGTVCKPWPPFFQKVVIKVSLRNTRSQSNMTIIWACHCCSKILVLTLFCCWHYSSMMFPSVWFHCFDGSDFDCTQGLFNTPTNKVWGVYCGGKELFWIILFLYPFVCLKTKNFQTQTWKLQFDFIWKLTRTLSDYAHLHHLDKI